MPTTMLNYEIETNGVPGIVEADGETVTYFDENYRWAIRIHQLPKYSIGRFSYSLWGVGTKGMQHIYSSKTAMWDRPDALQWARNHFETHWGVRF